jgi:hypothetical protein
LRNCSGIGGVAPGQDITTNRLNHLRVRDRACPTAAVRASCPRKPARPLAMLNCGVVAASDRRSDHLTE